MLTSIVEALEKLNWSYGCGDIMGVVMDTDWEGGIVTRKRRSCEPETRRFRFDSATNTIFFAGHQTKIT